MTRYQLEFSSVDFLRNDRSWLRWWRCQNCLCSDSSKQNHWLNLLTISSLWPWKSSRLFSTNQGQKLFPTKRMLGPRTSKNLWCWRIWTCWWWSKHHQWNIPKRSNQLYYRCPSETSQLHRWNLHWRYRKQRSWPWYRRYWMGCRKRNQILDC